MEKPDSIIFDMDGTLWDAVDTYATAWNTVFEKEHIHSKVTRSALESLMGLDKQKVINRLMPLQDFETQERVFKAVSEAQIKLVAQHGGTLYYGVKNGLERLSKLYKLFIVSNCPEPLIKKFIAWADIADCITDEMAHGFNMKPKHFNINLLIKRHNLQNSLYVGDTHSDSTESKIAGIPFIFLEHGFGSTTDYDLSFKDFESLTDYFLKLA